MANADPVRDEDLEDPQADAIALRHPAIPVTLSHLSTLKVGEAIEIIQARAQIIKTAYHESIALAPEAHFTLYRTPDGIVTAYLEDAGCQLGAKKIFGITSFDVGTPEKVMGDLPGEFHILITGSGRSSLTGETIERIEGGRSSTEDFCRGLTGVALELKVRKAARANLEGNITRRLAGLNRIPVEALQRAGKDPAKCAKGRGFGSRDERLGATRAGVPEVPAPICAVCKTPGVFRPGRDGRGGFYGCPNYTKHPDRKWTVDADRWVAEQAAKQPAPAPTNGAARTGPCEICGVPQADHANADHDFDGGGPQ
jgi:hypothetical protein